ncbi:MAG TPA: COX15/CtaA family protein [Bryobacteraceae bacterium]|nr:COX15/CtaA family protein [Bryobacteraceae bacterium]
MNRRFLRYAWFVLAYNVGVILWGAFVRATGSGAGCGEHWPLCNGVVMPRSPELATVIELTHRLTSGLAGVFVIVLVIAAFRVFPKGHVVRRSAVWSLALTLTEGLLGAGLVLWGHVAKNASVWRGVSLTVHLVNTLFLLAALACTAWFAHRVAREWGKAAAARSPLVVAATGLLFVGITGAIAALGDTLFRSESLAEGLARDFSPSAHIFLRLRILHPIAAVLMGVYLAVMSARVLAGAREGTVLRRLGGVLLALTGLQLALGALNLVLLAPVWMQILHLFAADAVWLSFVLLCAETWHPGVQSFSVKDVPAVARG